MCALLRNPSPLTVFRTEDWMKSFFENNRAYFEKQSVAQKLKKQGPPGESPAGVPSSAREKGKKPGTQMKLGPHHSHPVTIQ